MKNTQFTTSQLKELKLYVDMILDNRKTLKKKEKSIKEGKISRIGLGGQIAEEMEREYCDKLKTWIFRSDEMLKENARQEVEQIAQRDRSDINLMNEPVFTIKGSKYQRSLQSHL